MGAFFIRSVSDTIFFAMPFLPKPPEARRGSQCERRWHRGTLKNTENVNDPNTK
jgi:hypothetical protein